MPPISNSQKKRILNLRKAQEGAKRKRELAKAEKARREAEYAEYLAKGGEPRGLELDPEGKLILGVGLNKIINQRVRSTRD